MCLTETFLALLDIAFLRFPVFILNNFRLSRIILNLGEDSTSGDDTSDSDSELDSDLDEIYLDPSSTPEPVDAEYVKCCY